MKTNKNELKRLKQNGCGRYELDEYTELRSGSVVELSIDGKKWVKTSIESRNGEYYATVNPSLINLAGLFARIPEEA